jgi:hypothetical protein
MSVLGESLNALKSVLLLKDEVTRLGNNVAKMADRLDTLNGSVIRLEAHSDEALTRAQLAAQLAVAGELGPIKERLAKIEIFLRSGGNSPTPQILLPGTQKPEDNTSEPEGPSES